MHSIEQAKLSPQSKGQRGECDVGERIVIRTTGQKRLVHRGESHKAESVY